MEYTPQGLYTSLLYLIKTEQTAAKIQPHHFRLRISGCWLIQSYGDYWLYGGLDYISEAGKKKGERYLAAMQNLTATPEILIKAGAIMAGKKLSWTQRRKRRLLTLQLDAEEKEKKDKEIWISPEWTLKIPI